MTHQPASGLRAIIAYKTVKACIQLGLALVLLALWPLGLADKIRDLALQLQHHATHAWAIRLAAELAGHSDKRELLLALLALGGDGLLTSLEAWALAGRRWWGPWLVVAATASLLPFELYELVRAPHASRALILSLNLLILGYLARGAFREHRERRSSGAA
jgi:uncharacterized membrane protein (DUF2068 family)